MYMAERRDAEVKAQQRKETAASKHSEKKSAIKTTTENAVFFFPSSVKFLSWNMLSSA